MNRQPPEGLGAILTYTSKGSGRVGGQQVGADGSGDYAVMFYGDPQSAEDAAYEYVREMQRKGTRIKYATVVACGAEFGYYGNPVSAIDVATGAAL